MHSTTRKHLVDSKPTSSTEKTRLLFMPPTCIKLTFAMTSGLLLHLPYPHHLTVHISELTDFKDILRNWKCRDAERRDVSISNDQLSPVLRRQKSLQSWTVIECTSNVLCTAVDNCGVLFLIAFNASMRFSSFKRVDLRSRHNSNSRCT